MILSDNMYNVLKWVVQIVLPAIGTLYFTLAQIWHLPAGEQVVGTCSALALFLGALIGISSTQYYKLKKK